jgi:hypothetical protein
VAIYHGSTCVSGRSPVLLRQGWPSPAVSRLFGYFGRLYQLLRSKTIQNAECGGIWKEAFMTWRNGEQLGIQVGCFRRQVRRSTVLLRIAHNQLHLAEHFFSRLFKKLPSDYIEPKALLSCSKKFRRGIHFRDGWIAPAISHPGSVNIQYNSTLKSTVNYTTWSVSISVPYWNSVCISHLIPHRCIKLLLFFERYTLCSICCPRSCYFLPLSSTKSLQPCSKTSPFCVLSLGANSDFYIQIK